MAGNMIELMRDRSMLLSNMIMSFSWNRFAS